LFDPIFYEITVYKGFCMHDKKLIKKIFNLARYDFIQNFNNWVSITGLLAAMTMVIVGLICCVTKNYDLHVWKLPMTLFADIQTVFARLIACLPQISSLFEQELLLQIVSYSLAFCGDLFFAYLFVVVVQNCLDLAFDSAMSGFSINCDRFYVVFVSWFAVTTLIASELFNYGKTSFFDYVAFNYFLIACLIITILYCSQILYVISMHQLEYKKGYVQSCKEVFQMAHDNMLLCKILGLQIFAGTISIAGIYFLLDSVMGVFIRCMVWPLNMLQIITTPTLILFLSNFFYAWAYLMVYAWICLVWAHLYRQLVCPPVDNPSCLSCKSCPK
jgi:hypothetical protein